jgi:gluconolactonase
MAQDSCNRANSGRLSRRMLLKVMGAVAAASVPHVAMAQAPPGGPAAPPSTVTSPPRDFGPNAPPTTYFTDPDILSIDPLFNSYRQPNTPIMRLWTGALWSEGPAWSSQGRYLVWSDIPNNRQPRS